MEGTRTCEWPSNLANECKGASCVGSEYDWKLCPIDGGWSNWSEWGPCHHETMFSQSRYRTCTNPAPANGGQPCSGSNREDQFCGFNF